MTTTRLPKTHHLKTWPAFYKAVTRANPKRRKTFEVRRNDRGFAVGDTLVLQEWDPETESFTGRETPFEVTYVFRDGDKEHRGPFDEPVVAGGYCVMGIDSLVPLGEPDEEGERVQNLPPLEAVLDPDARTSLCSVCLEVQFETASGVTCKNGHGGAPALP